jgi:hypothetical protein
MELFSASGRNGWSAGVGNQDPFPANRGFRAQAGCQRGRSRTQAGYTATPRPHPGNAECRMQNGECQELPSGLPRGYPEATLRPSGGQPVGTLKPPRGYPEATLRLSSGYPQATPAGEGSGRSDASEWAAESERFQRIALALRHFGVFVLRPPDNCQQAARDALPDHPCCACGSRHSLAVASP